MKISWPVGIIISFALFCSFMVGFTIYSVQHKNELVDKDYYAKDLRYQEIINYKANLQALGQPVSIQQQAEALLLALPEVLQQADSGSVDFYRPNDQRRDFEIGWSELQTNNFSVPSSQLGTGRWVVTIMAYKDGKGYFSEHKLNME